MLPTPPQLRSIIDATLTDLAAQGHDVAGTRDELASTGNSLDALAAFTVERLGNGGPPMRGDWPYVEPHDLDAIAGEALGFGDDTSFAVDDPAARVRDAFTARVCGCMLGKPFEIFVSLDEIRAALASTGEWPLADYPSEAALRALPTLQGQWPELHREGIAHVAPDDDINYTILAMLVLEEHGTDFTHDHLRTLWLYNLPVLVTFGPERTRLLRSGLLTLFGGDPVLASLLNPGAELCGALIRADAYGYAAIGRPALAATLAHRDASFTHSRTGVYGAMFVAAAIAVAPAVHDPLDIVRTALRYVPQRSRFAERATHALDIVERADDWLAAHATIRERFGEYGFCAIYQEVATLINTLRFADDTAHGICLQVMQGLDTDSFGATAGSILGPHLGPIAPRWTAPFNDTVHSALALFHEQSLGAITDRMAALPARIDAT